MYEGAMPSRSASSAMVANSPDSSILFQRNARAGALARDSSGQRCMDVGSSSCISFRPLICGKRDVLSEIRHGPRFSCVYCGCRTI